MARASSKSTSLATGILRVTLGVGAIIVTAALFATFTESYRLAASGAEERMGAYLEVMRSEVSGRLSATAAAIGNAASTIQEVPAERVNTRLMASRYASAAHLLDSLVLLTPDGEVVASYPDLGSSPATSTYDFVQDTSAGSTEFHRSAAAGDGPSELWTSRRFHLADGREVILAGKVRSDLFILAAGRVASGTDHRSAVVVDSDGLVAGGVGGPALNVPTARYDVLSSGGVGDVRVVAPSVGGMRGLWSPVDRSFGVDWRVLVVEPSRAAILTSLGASIPTLIVLVFGGTIALGLAWLVGRRLAYPLREIEAASYEAAKGAYVAPLRPGRVDEVGKLAEAFNAVGLRLNALHDVSRLLAGASRLDEVLDAVIEAVEHLLGPGMVAIYLTDATQQSLHLARASGAFQPPSGPIPRSHSGPFEDALGGDRIETPEPEELPMHGWDIGDGPCRVLVAPLIAGRERIGVLVVLQHGRSEYSDAETEMVRTFSSQTAIGVMRAGLFEREVESRRTAESLRDVAEELVRPVAFADALVAVTDVVSRVLEGRHVFFAFEDREALGLPPSGDADLEDMVLKAAASALASGGRSKVVGRGSFADVDELLDRQTSGEIVLSRIEPDEPYQGAFAVFSNGTTFESRDVELVEGVIKIVTLALDNAYFFERSKVRARNLETIFRISQAVGSSLQIKIVLNRVLDVVQMIFTADAVSLMTYDPGKRIVTTAMARGAVSSEILHLDVVPGEDLPGRVFATGEPIMLRDIRASTFPLAMKASDLGLRSLLCVPLLARGSAVGVLSVFSESAGAFDDEDMGLLQTFASQAALAMDTARLYSREHQVADTLQRSILPEKVPEFAEIEAATAYEPAGTEAEIGGDYYDLLRAPDGRIVIAVADVCGKGVEAATKTSMVKYSIRALVAAGFGPGACLKEVNRMIAANQDPGDILSVWLGYLDGLEGHLLWANGGHPPALVLCSSPKRILRLAPTGPILGAREDVSFDEESVDLSTGDTLLLYTDGVTETRRGNKFFGEGRVRRSLGYGGSPKDVVERLLGALTRFSPGELRDDVAVVAIRLREVSDRPSDDGSERGA